MARAGYLRHSFRQVPIFGIRLQSAERPPGRGGFDANGRHPTMIRRSSGVHSAPQQSSDQPSERTAPVPELPPPDSWFADGLRFSCTRCGRCCGGAPGYVWVSDAEIAGLAAAVQLTPAEFRERHTRKVGSRRSLLEHADGDCEFLIRDESGKAACSVHASRPLQCRTWPFWKSTLRSGRAWAATARWCPGMNQGEHHPLPVIQEALRRNEEAQLDL